MSPPFSGSYAPDEVQFLLTPMRFADTPVAEKEALIQSGQKHYAEMLTHEQLPSAAYEALFLRALSQNRQRMAQHLWLLAQQIVATRPQGITLVSLARAGTPVGVLLKHILAAYYQRPVAHYSVSIFRDLGLDLHALRYILQRHPAETLVWIDGWTGKGVIARQLAASLQAFAETDALTIAPELYVLTDLCGSASVSASTQDYLIPSSVLNATVSGLVSRSIYAQNHQHAAAFHGCIYYENFAPRDWSRYFVTEMLHSVAQIQQQEGLNKLRIPTILERRQLQAQAQHFLAWVSERYAMTKVNSIKLGVGESTRALLRREAQRLLLQNAHADAVQHLIWLASAKAIPVEVVSDMPYAASVLIKELAL